MHCLDKYNGGRFEETLMVLFMFPVCSVISITFMFCKPIYAFPWSLLRTVVFLFALTVIVFFHFILLPFDRIRGKMHSWFSVIMEILLYDFIEELDGVSNGKS